MHKQQSNVKVTFFPVLSNKKLEALFQVLKENEGKEKHEKTIVFCNTVSSARAIEHHLKENGFNSINLHAEILPQERKRLYEKFVGGEENEILVCTDIASRGLDTVSVEHVVLFDFPLSITDYLHRVGRTGRFHRKGKVTAFVTKRDKSLAQQIQDAIQKNKTLEGISNERSSQIVLISPYFPLSIYPPFAYLSLLISPIYFPYQSIYSNLFFPFFNSYLFLFSIFLNSFFSIKEV